MSTQSELARFDEELDQLAATVIRDISPKDNMFTGDEDTYMDVYLGVGRSALRAVKLASLHASKDDHEIRRILDFPCGHGRVLRYLKAAYPHADIVACDIWKDAVDFCAATFAATPVYSSAKIDQIPIDEEFDLIWCGSLLTHVNSDYWMEFLGFFDSVLAPGGLLVFTTHGNRFVETVKQGRSYNLDERKTQSILRGYESQGFGYEDYVETALPNYGISLSKLSWVLSCLESFPDLSLLTCTDRGWADFQDVVSCVKKAS